jgi:hypothetical protein
VLGELLRGQPLFGGRTEIETIDLIFGLLVRNIVCRFPEIRSGDVAISPDVFISPYSPS